MNTKHLFLSRICAATLFIAASAFAAAPPGEAQTRYEQERARCMGGQSGQAQETCLKEAGAARDASKKGQLSDGEGRLKKNANDRCDALTGDERRDCIARVKGAVNSSETGSVKGGGIIRETRTIEPAPAASAASAK